MKTGKKRGQRERGTGKKDKYVKGGKQDRGNGYWGGGGNEDREEKGTKGKKFGGKRE